MNAVFLCLTIVVIIIAIILLIYTNIYNKFQENIIRIKEVEDNIDKLLKKKYDLINRTIAIIKGNVTIEKDIFDTIIKLRSRKVSSFDLDKELAKAHNEFIALKEEYKKLDDSEELAKITKSLDNIDKKLEILKEYYDETVSCYNKLLLLFPTNLVATICKYKTKDFYHKQEQSNKNKDEFDL